MNTLSGSDLPAETQSYLQRLGMTLEKGVLKASESTPVLMQIERLRQAQIQRTPSAPRYLTPDANGQGVTRNAWSEPLTDRHLRQYARKSPVAVKVRQACMSGVAATCNILADSQKGIGLRVGHKNQLNQKPVPKDFDNVVSYAREILQKPFKGDAHSPAVLSTQQLVQGLYGDIFDLNRGVLEPIWRGDRVIGCRPADAGIIIPAWDVVRRWVAVHAESTEDLTKLSRPAQIEAISEKNFELTANRYGLSRAVNADISGAKWVIFRDGVIDGTLSHNQVIVIPQLTSTDINFIGYPPGYLQMAMEFIAMDWVVHDYHGRKFTDAAWSSMLIAVMGDGYDEEGFESFFNQMRGIKGYQRAGLPAIIKVADGGDIKTVDLKPPVTDMEFGKLKESTEAGVCAIVRRHPSIINGVIAQAGGPRLNGSNEETAIELARQEGHQLDMQHIAAYLSEFCEIFIHPDLRVWADFSTVDLKALADLHAIEVKTTKTRNEIRNETIGLKPIGFFLPAEDVAAATPEQLEEFYANPWNYPADAPILSQMQTMQAMKQAAAAPPATPPAENTDLAKGSPTLPDAHCCDWSTY